MKSRSSTSSTEAGPEPDPPALRGAEDQGRANFYALLSRLFYGGPDAALLQAIAAADAIGDEGDKSALEQAWHALAQASATTDAIAAKQEYDDLFIGTGKALVTLYASHYFPQSGGDPLLVGLRSDLAGLGLARRHSANEPEDHIAALFDVMRFLILQEGDSDDTLQKRFFCRYIAPQYAQLCDAISKHSDDYYGQVARFANIFLRIESEAFDIS